VSGVPASLRDVAQVTSAAEWWYRSRISSPPAYPDAPMIATFMDQCFYSKKFNGYWLFLSNFGIFPIKEETGKNGA
jgi:hypothetical protein